MRRLRVKLGKHDAEADREAGLEARRVAAVLAHPGYKPAPRFWNDVAVLQLDRAVTYRCGQEQGRRWSVLEFLSFLDIDICSPTIQPICINSLAGADLTGETMTVVGWGRTSDGGPRARYLR